MGIDRTGDTSIEADEVRLTAIRAMSPEARLRQTLEFSETMRRVMLAGLRRHYPGRSDLELVELSLGRALIPPGARPPGP